MKKMKNFILSFLAMMIASFFFMDEGFATCPDGISTYWKLDETVGSTYMDFIGDNDGTGNDDPTPQTSGIVEGAQSFDGANTGIDVLASSSFGWLSSESFSVELWVKTDGTVAPASNQVLVGRDDADTGMQWWVGLQEVSGNASFYLVDADGNVADLLGRGVSVSDGDWHHIVAVRDGSTNDNSIYVDGAVQGSSVIQGFSAGFGSQTATLNIGYLDLAPFYRFGGLIDEVALYNRALPLNEIQDHYTAGLAGNGVQTLRPAPVADAGNDQSVTEGDMVTLDGTGSTDENGTIATYSWEQTGGTTVTLAGAATATFTAPDVDNSGEILTFQLTVTDNDGLTGKDTIDVTVSNRDVAPATDSDDDSGFCFISTIF